MLGCESLHDSMSLGVPTFYSPKFTDYNPNDPSIAVATIFGAIHCIAWSLHFPSLQERLAWKISAASITGSPILFIVFVDLFIILEQRFEGLRETTLEVAILGLSVLYVIVRIVLLVLPCIALRALLPPALVEIQWAAFFPHIG